MTRAMLLVLALLVPAVTASGGQSAPVRSDQQIFIDRVLAEEFVSTYGDGSRGDRAKELKLAVDFDQQVDSSTLDEFVVKVYGDTAVVWFTQHLLGPSKGQPLAVTYRYVDVFVMRDGRWQCVASQSTKVTAT
jgi:hypothetical protein